MTATSENCIELTFDLVPFESALPNTIFWELSDQFYSDLVSGTIAPNETTTSACFQEDFRCAKLDAWDVSGDNSGTLQLRWNGVVWADQNFDFHTMDSSKPLVWLGEECQDYLYNVCHYDDDSWLLDFQLSTTANTTENSVYWRLYSKIDGGNRGNVLHDQYFRRYQANTTYRTLQCIKDENWMGCTELGLTSTSTVVPGSMHIRVDGQESQDPGWECYEGLCHGDIVFPLRNCDSSTELSKEAVAGLIATAAIVGVAFLCGGYFWGTRGE